jgi:hypothetical protein
MRRHKLELCSKIKKTNSRTVDVHVLHVFVHAEEVVGRLRQAVAGAHAETAVGRLLARVVRQTAEEGVHARRPAHHVARHRVLLSQGRRLPHHQSLLLNIKKQSRQIKC